MSGPAASALLSVGQGRLIPGTADAGGFQRLPSHFYLVPA
jgi:hypothetical protein